MSTEFTRESRNYGPAMMALSNDRQRNFVIALVTGEPAHGCLTRAYLAAGYEPSNRKNAGKAAHELSRDERVIAAIAEEARKTVRVHHPEAALALLNLIRNPEHKDHARAVAMVLDRVDPVNSHQSVTVSLRAVAEMLQQALRLV
jgi:phage terminase small subunit